VKTLLGIFGWPVAHSKSPAMHGAAIAALGLDAVYLPFAVRPEALPDAVRGLRGLGVRGVNVTLPHKAAVIPLLDAVDPDAEAIGAVNTVVNDDGVLRGYNTDAPGLVRSIEEAGVAIAGRRVTVLGAGGAARAAVVGLQRAGAAEITLLARRPEAAQFLAEELRGDGAVPLLGDGLDALEARFAHTDLLVQSTSATLGGGPDAEAFAAKLPFGALPKHAAVVDLVYQPLRTSVLRAAEAEGLATVDGLGMLLHQGALAFRLFTGHEPPLEVMAEALGRPPAATMSTGSRTP
jgi:shikimate dehydrogenase